MDSEIQKDLKLNTYHSSLFLVQTDTTVGFLSNDLDRLYSSKQRDKSKKILQEVDSFHTLKTLARVPSKYKKLVRNSIKTTFIYPNGNSFRVVDKNSSHHNFISKFKTMYSTSANISGSTFNEEFARGKADIIVEDSFNYLEPSKIYKISNYKKLRIR
ncbi:MAG: Sua5 YciO YrdC YwlC family protein [Arcobacteraceae bacterium]|nr:Sua5 YciO YrdC YwlC family protein [Arcobacteraceae bacterium]